MGEGAPRAVNFGDLFTDESHDKLPAGTEKIFATTWGTIFAAFQLLDPVFDFVEADNGQVIQIPIWPIDAEESGRLGAATAALLKGLPAADKKRAARFLNKYAPWIAFTLTIGQITGPRARFSMDYKRFKRNETLAAASGRDRGGAAAQGASAAGTPGAASAGFHSRGAANGHVASAFDGV